MNDYSQVPASVESAREIVALILASADKAKKPRFARRSKVDVAVAGNVGAIAQNVIADIYRSNARLAAIVIAQIEAMAA